MRVLVVAPPAPVVTPADVPGDHAADDATVAARILAATAEIDGPAGRLGRAIGPPPHVLASGNGALFSLFFSDGTKFLRFYPAYVAAVLKMSVDYYSAPTTFVAARKSQTTTRSPDPIWLQIGDDGTNFIFSVSSNGGRTWTLFYSIAKASSDLSAGYSRIGFDFYDGGVANQGSLLSWN